VVSTMPTTESGLRISLTSPATRYFFLSAER